MPGRKKPRGEDLHKPTGRTPARRKRAKAKGRENHNFVTPGTTTMGLVLDSHQAQAAKEAFQENTDAQVVEVPDILRINAHRRPPRDLVKERLGEHT